MAHSLMVHKAAKAIAKSMGRTTPNDDDVVSAKSAFESLLLPTPAMVNAGAKIGNTILARSGYPANSPNDIFEAMIRAALTSQEQFR